MADTEDDVVMKADGDEEDTKDEEEKEKTTKEKKKEKPKGEEKLTHLSIPLARVKKIMKLDKDVKLISSDAALLIAKATEYFIEYFVKQGYNITKEEKRKILNYKDLATVVKDIDSFEFLADIIPEKRIFNKQTEATATKTKKTKEKDEGKDDGKDEVKDEDKDDDKDDAKDESKSDTKDEAKGKKKDNITKYFAVRKDVAEDKEDDS